MATCSYNVFFIITYNLSKVNMNIFCEKKYQWTISEMECSDKKILQKNK